jgi:membrane-bound lytic murein transglycosylase B
MVSQKKKQHTGGFMQYARLSAGFLALFLLTERTDAQGLSLSLRPELRPETHLLATVFKDAQTDQNAPGAIRPQQRPEGLAKAMAELAAASAGFQRWVDGFAPRARAQGISIATFSAAFQDVQFDPAVIKRDRNQSEFTKSIWEYLESAASDARIENGRTALQKHRRTLSAIETRYGVDKEVVVAVWGLETGYGAYRGSEDVIQSLATLAYEGRRGAFFEEQLIAALKILQNGDTQPRNMRGSWAGAMGHTQFIPTSYLAYAVDFNKDGRRDIWSEDPTDALASTAAYLKKSGWKTGQPWGVEVILPRGFDYALANREIKKLPAQWARLGVVDMNDRAVPNHGAASLLLPAGAQGAAFMIFDNFSAIEKYNAADAYVIGVGHLSDRIRGGPPIKSSWPTTDRALSLSERKEMQQHLTQAGFDTKGIDGRIGPNTIEAVREFQQARGLAPDGYPSMQLLQRLR